MSQTTYRRLMHASSTSAEDCNIPGDTVQNLTKSCLSQLVPEFTESSESLTLIYDQGRFCGQNYLVPLEVIESNVNQLNYLSQKSLQKGKILMTEQENLVNSPRLENLVSSTDCLPPEDGNSTKSLVLTTNGNGTENDPTSVIFETNVNVPQIGKSRMTSKLTEATGSSTGNQWLVQMSENVDSKSQLITRLTEKDIDNFPPRPIDDDSAHITPEIVEDDVNKPISKERETNDNLASNFEESIICHAITDFKNNTDKIVLACLDKCYSIRRETVPFDSCFIESLPEMLEYDANRLDISESSTNDITTDIQKPRVNHPNILSSVERCLSLEITNSCANHVENEIAMTFEKSFVLEVLDSVAFVDDVVPNLDRKEKYDCPEINDSPRNCHAWTIIENCMKNCVQEASECGTDIYSALSKCGDIQDTIDKPSAENMENLIPYDEHQVPCIIELNGMNPAPDNPFAGREFKLQYEKLNFKHGSFNNSISSGNNCKSADMNCSPTLVCSAKMPSKDHGNLRDNTKKTSDLSPDKKNVKITNESHFSDKLIKKENVHSFRTSNDCPSSGVTLEDFNDGTAISVLLPCLETYIGQYVGIKQRNVSLSSFQQDWCMDGTSLISTSYNEPDILLSPFSKQTDKMSVFDVCGKNTFGTKEDVKTESCCKEYLISNGQCLENHVHLECMEELALAECLIFDNLSVSNAKPSQSSYLKQSDIETMDLQRDVDNIDKLIKDDFLRSSPCGIVFSDISTNLNLDVDGRLLIENVLEKQATVVSSSIFVDEENLNEKTCLREDESRQTPILLANVSFRCEVQDEDDLIVNETAQVTEIDLHCADITEMLTTETCSTNNQDELLTMNVIQDLQTISEDCMKLSASVNCTENNHNVKPTIDDIDMTSKDIFSTRTDVDSIKITNADTSELISPITNVSIVPEPADTEIVSKCVSLLSHNSMTSTAESIHAELARDGDIDLVCRSQSCSESYLKGSNILLDAAAKIDLNATKQTKVLVIDVNFDVSNVVNVYSQSKYDAVEPILNYQNVVILENISTQILENQVYGKLMHTELASKNCTQLNNYIGETYSGYIDITNVTSKDTVSTGNDVTHSSETSTTSMNTTNYPASELNSPIMNISTVSVPVLAELISKCVQTAPLDSMISTVKSSKAEPASDHLINCDIITIQEQKDMRVSGLKKYKPFMFEKESSEDKVPLSENVQDFTRFCSGNANAINFDVTGMEKQESFNESYDNLIMEMIHSKQSSPVTSMQADKVKISGTGNIDICLSVPFDCIPLAKELAYFDEIRSCKPDIIKSGALDGENENSSLTKCYNLIIQSDYPLHVEETTSPLVKMCQDSSITEAQKFDVLFHHEVTELNIHKIHAPLNKGMSGELLSETDVDVIGCHLLMTEPQFYMDRTCQILECTDSVLQSSPPMMYPLDLRLKSNNFDDSSLGSPPLKMRKLHDSRFFNNLKTASNDPSSSNIGLSLQFENGIDSKPESMI